MPRASPAGRRRTGPPGPSSTSPGRGRFGGCPRGARSPSSASGPGRAARGCPPGARGGRAAGRGAGARTERRARSAGCPQKSSDPRSASDEPVLCETATTRLYRATPVSSVSHVERVASSAWSVAVPRVGKRSVRLFCCAPTPTVQRTSAPLWGASWMRSIARFGGWAAERRSPSPRARFDSRSRPRWSPEPEPIRRGAGLWPCPPATVRGWTSVPPLRRWPPTAPPRSASRSAVKRCWWPWAATSRRAGRPRPGGGPSEPSTRRMRRRTGPCRCAPAAWRLRASRRRSRRSMMRSGSRPAWPPEAVWKRRSRPRRCSGWVRARPAGSTSTGSRPGS